MKEIYVVEHHYIEDCEYGDLEYHSDAIVGFASKKDAEEFIKKYHDPRNGRRRCIENGELTITTLPVYSVKDKIPPFEWVDTDEGYRYLDVKEETEEEKRERLRTEMLTSAKKEAKKIAKELGYPREILDRISLATSAVEIDRIMTTARQKAAEHYDESVLIQYTTKRRRKKCS